MSPGDFAPVDTPQPEMALDLVDALSPESLSGVMMEERLDAVLDFGAELGREVEPISPDSTVEHFVPTAGVVGE